jgi:hypothetical protein
MGPRRVSRAGVAGYTFSLVYRDDGQVNPALFNNTDIEITGGPTGATYRARFLAAVPLLGGAQYIVNYHWTAPGGSFGAEDNGVYTVKLRSNQIGDTEGNLTMGRTLGTIRVAIPIIAVTAPFSAMQIGAGEWLSIEEDDDDDGRRSLPEV